MKEKKIEIEIEFKLGDANKALVFELGGASAVDYKLARSESLDTLSLSLSLARSLVRPIFLAFSLCALWVARAAQTTNKPRRRNATREAHRQRCSNSN